MAVKNPWAVVFGRVACEQTIARLHLANTIYNFCCSHVCTVLAAHGRQLSCQIGSERRRMPRDHRRRRMRIVWCANLRFKFHMGWQF